MNAAPAHSKFGGSGAERLLRCPGNVRLNETVPAHLRGKSSAYAERGTALHLALGMLIERVCTLEEFVGKAVGNYTITRDDVENALRPVYDYVDALLARSGVVYHPETRFQFPTVDGAYGTADLLVRDGKTVHLLDYKFGSGVRVCALYPDGEEDILNAQLLFYIASARHTLPEFFAGVDTIILTILQPVSLEPGAGMVSSVTVCHDEIDQFIGIYRTAAEEALSGAPRLARGDWCRFCAARPLCSEHTGPVFDLAMFEVPTPPRTPANKETYLRALAEGLNLVDAIKEISKALHDQAKAALENGDQAPGFALTEGRAVRHWRDETTVAPDLLKLGLARDDVLVETLRSPKQVELRAKARGVKIPKALIDSHPSGVSLVRIENARAPILSQSERIKSWAEVIDTIQRR